MGHPGRQHHGQKLVWIAAPENLISVSTWPAHVPLMTLPQLVSASSQSKEDVVG